MFLKLIAFIVLAVGVSIVILHHLNEWSARLRRYMIDQSYKLFGSGNGWDESFGQVLSKTLVFFFGFMLIVAVYAAILSAGTSNGT